MKELFLSTAPEMRVYVERISLYKATLLSFLVSVFTAFLCTNSKEGFNTYMGIALPLFVIYFFIFILSQAMLADLFAFSSVYLISLGITLQILLSCSDGKEAVVTASKLCIYIIIGILTGFLSVITIYFLMRIKRRKLHIILGTISLLCYVLLMVIGVSTGGTTAWIFVGGTSIQITEITKTLAVAQIALLVTDSSLSNKQRVFLPALTVAIHALFLVSISELGTLLVIGFSYIILSFIFLPSSSIKYLVIILLSFIGLAMLIVTICFICHKTNADSGIFRTFSVVFEKIQQRLILYINPSALDFDSSYQVMQMKKALSVANLIGSSIKLTIPVVESDLVMLYLIQTFGLISFFTTLIVYVIFFHSGICRLTKKCNSLTAIGVGFITIITVTALLSTASSLCMIPLVGLGAPFISNGGSGLVVHTAMVIFCLISMIDPIPGKEQKLLKGDKLCRK